MKVLLLQDVYNLGRAGDVKKVANGYGRNYLIPQGMAVLATPGSLKQVERIRETANKQRAILNEEMSAVVEGMQDLRLEFPARAGETGKLYGSVTTQMIANELTEQLKVEITKRMIDTQPIRLLGMHTVNVRLTMDLIPEVSVVVYREGEPIENYLVDADELAAQAEEDYVDPVMEEELVDEEEVDEGSDAEAADADEAEAEVEEAVEPEASEAQEEGEESETPSE